MLVEMILFGIISLITFTKFKSALAVVIIWGFSGLALLTNMMGITGEGLFFMFFIVFFVVVIVTVMMNSYYEVD